MRINVFSTRKIIINMYFTTYLVTKTLIFYFSVLLALIGFCLLTNGKTIEKVQGFQQVAGPIIINASPGTTKSFSWGLLAGNNETSLLKIYADGNGSEFLSYPEVFKLDPGKINYLVGNVTIPVNQGIDTTFTPIIHSTLSENETENTGGNDVNVELSKILTISIGGNQTGIPSNLTSNPSPTGPLSGLESKGTVNSIITTPSTKWIASGNWSLNIYNDNVSSFESKMNINDVNGTNSHTEQFQNFRTSGPILLNKSDSNFSLRGLMDLAANNKVAWKDVPAVIDIKGKKTISISVDNNITNNHFASQPILGVINFFQFCSDVPGPNMEISAPCNQSSFLATDSTLPNGESSMSTKPNLPQQSTLEPDLSGVQLITPQNQSGLSNPSYDNASTSSIDTDFGNDSNQLLTYENKIFGLELRYPSNWNMKQGSTDNPSLKILSVLSPVKDGDSSFRIGIDSSDAELMNIAEFANNTISKYEKEIPGFKTILYNPDSVLSGYPAYQIEGSYTYENSVKQHLTETGVLFNSKVYIFQFNTPDSKSDNYLPSVRAMVESVELTPSQQSSELTTEMDGNGNLSQSIASSFEKSASGESVQGCPDVTILNATANGFESDPEDYNPPSDAVDGDMKTWWAYKGVPSWLQIELDNPTTICAVEIAWNKGNERTYEFTIAASSDGNKFTEVFSGKSSGKKESFETYQINSSPTDVRTVKLSFSGSSSDKGWVSIREIKLLGR
jgi:hypothetical protein